MAERMRQTGIVLAAEGGMATVRFNRTDACGRCRACFTLSETEADIEIANTLNAQPGDRVVIELHGGSVFKASLIMYGVPLAALIIGVAIGSVIGDIWAAAGGLLFAAGSFFILRALEPRFSRMGQFKPRMIEIADEQPDNDTVKGEDGNE